MRRKIPIKDSSDEQAAEGNDNAGSKVEVELEQSPDARIAQLEKELSEAKDQYLRAMADFQNYRRRSDEQRGESAQFANREPILGLLPVLDDFDGAMAAAEESQSFEKLMGGVALTQRKLQDFLAKHGVEPIEATGAEFDPNYHEAIGRVEDSEHPENTVVEDLRKGYKMHNRVLRPSMVKVATHG